MQSRPELPKSLSAAVGAVRSRTLSVEEIAEATIDAIARDDVELQAFTALEVPAELRRQAQAVDRKLRSHPHGLDLAGVVIGVKEIIDAKGLPTSYNSPAFAPRVASADAACVARLRRAGALIVGKTRTSEFALAPDTVPTANPADRRLIPCGSSGGSAAAVGAGLVTVALGTDSGGSIRAPSALCGVTGLKPTFGLVSTAGVLPLAPALDTVGPIASSVSDVRAALTHMLDGSRPEDARRLERVRAGLQCSHRSRLADVRLGLVDDPVLEIVEARARTYYDESLAAVRSAGASLIEVELPRLRYAFGTALALILGDGSILTDVIRDRPEMIAGDDVRSALRVAHAIPAVLVTRAETVRAAIVQEVADVFRAHRLDGLILPASVAPAVERGNPDRTFTRADGTEEAVLWWGYPRPFYLANLTGQPSIVLPMTRQSPPLGIQLVGRPFDDHVLLDIAEAVEDRLRA